LNFALQSLWTEALFRAVRWIYKVEVAVEGLDQVQPSPFLLWVRHTSLADTVLAAVMIANPHRIGLRYVLKRELLWDPCLDVVGRRLPNVFVDRSRRRSDLELASVQALARDLGAGQGVLIYPEGTRFSAKKLEQACNVWPRANVKTFIGWPRNFDRCFLPAWAVRWRC
jgi:1-acyl-sn-glycerol-3-phosphate acyltransferase